MFLSEAEAEARLDDLRAQRAALDRAIAEHELYLDLGRRLARPGIADPVPAQTQGPVPVAQPRPGPAPAASAPVAPMKPTSQPTARNPPPPAARPAARGRRLIEAAEEILSAAGRPMHAAEIWERLAARGLTPAGSRSGGGAQHPLWKRAQGGAVFRRLGDGVYGLAP